MLFGGLWQFYSVVCDLQIIVCCLKPPIMSPILRKQCVNILFQLWVFSDIQRKSHFRKTLIFSTLYKQQNIMEYHFAILIIWRSQVQALAGSHEKALAKKSQVLFFDEYLAKKVALLFIGVRCKGTMPYAVFLRNQTPIFSFFFC